MRQHSFCYDNNHNPPCLQCTICTIKHKEIAPGGKITQPMYHNPKLTYSQYFGRRQWEKRKCFQISSLTRGNTNNYWEKLNLETDNDNVNKEELVMTENKSEIEEDRVEVVH